MVSTISILGADDSVAPQDLVDISITYPFVEWGVNLCPEPEQKPKFPSEEWLEELYDNSENLRLRAILHNRWESDILEGTLSLKIEKPEVWNVFNSIQVDIREGQKNIVYAILAESDKLILETNNIVNFKANILLPRSKLFTCSDYCGYSIFDYDLNWLCRDINKSFWVSVDGFRTDDKITMDLSKVERFLERAEDFVTHDSFMLGIKHAKLRIP
jgi:hypothetical protein